MHKSTQGCMFGRLGQNQGLLLKHHRDLLIKSSSSSLFRSLMQLSADALSAKKYFTLFYFFYLCIKFYLEPNFELQFTYGRQASHGKLWNVSDLFLIEWEDGDWPVWE